MRKKLGQRRLRKEELTKAAFEAAEACINLSSQDGVDRRSCQAGVLEMIRALRDTIPPLAGKNRKLGANMSVEAAMSIDAALVDSIWACNRDEKTDAQKEACNRGVYKAISRLRPGKEMGKKRRR